MIPGFCSGCAFIDCRRSPVARVCITPNVPGRQVIGISAGTFATVNAPPGPRRLSLADGMLYRFERKGAPFKFAASKGMLRETPLAPVFVLVALAELLRFGVGLRLMGLVLRFCPRKLLQP